MLDASHGGTVALRHSRPTAVAPNWPSYNTGWIRGAHLDVPSVMVEADTVWTRLSALRSDAAARNNGEDSIPVASGLA